MHPGIVRAVSSVDLRKPLRAALESLSYLTRENARLRVEVAQRDEHIRELQQMLERVLA